MTTQTTTTKWLRVLALCLLAAPAPAFAQAGAQVIEEIVVTARMRGETLHDVPVTVNAISAQDIEDAGIQKPGDYLALIPNVTIVEAQNAGTSFITIRGITQVRNNEPPVAVAVDGMLQTNPNQFNQTLLDIQQIEVLKGPQGALYGRNAIGGAINITTKRPTNEFEGRIKGGVGNGDHRDIQASISGPLVEDKVFARLSGTYLDRDGLISNTFRGDHVDWAKDKSLQLRVDWLLNDAWSVDARAYWSETQGGALPYNWQIYDYAAGAFDFSQVPDANDTDVVYEMNNRGKNDRDILELAVKLQYEGEWGTFTSITARNELEEWYGSDQAPYSRSLTQFPFGPAAGPFDAIAQQYWDVDAISQEIRFTSKSTQRLRWLFGAYYVTTDRFISSPIVDDVGTGIVRVTRRPTGPGQPTTFSFIADDNDNDAYAFFAQFNYDVTDNLEASLAIRHDEDDRKQTVSEFNTNGNQGAVRKETFSKTQPKFTLRYMPTEDINLYASYSEGFRSGQFNQPGTAAAATAAGFDGVFDVVDQEETEAWELGLKSLFMDGLLGVNVALFRTDVEGQQYFLFFAPTSSQVLAGIDEVKLTGGELEVNLSPVEGLDIYAAYGVTDSEIEAYAVNPALTGNKAPYVPKDTINAGFQYRLELTGGLAAVARVDYERRGKQYWDPENSTARDPVDLIRARLSLEGASWSVSAWSNNLTDEEYLAEYVLGGFVQLAPPRSYGVDLKYFF